VTGNGYSECKAGKKLLIFTMKPKANEKAVKRTSVLTNDHDECIEYWYVVTN